MTKRIRGSAVTSLQASRSVGTDTEKEDTTTPPRHTRHQDIHSSHLLSQNNFGMGALPFGIFRNDCFGDKMLKITLENSEESLEERTQSNAPNSNASHCTSVSD